MARAAALPITEFGNPVLSRKAKRVTRAYLDTDECATLIKNMVHTMRKSGGVGIAAPQVGVSLQIAVMEIRSTPNRPDSRAHALQVIINPRILAYEGTLVQKWEGCLSLHTIFGQVPRFPRVVVEYMDAEGTGHTEKANGLWAHIFQHEIDHLQGIRYVDRMTKPETLMVESEFRKMMLRKKAPKQAS